MAVEIVDVCVSCWACVDVCPSNAIAKGQTHMAVNAKKCTECEGDYADPQCASICPIESCILDAQGLAFNPPGSLTGIPPELLAEAMNEIQAR